MVGFILFCVLICLCLAWACKLHLRFGRHKLPPLHPQLLPIIGHAHLLVGDGLSVWRNLKMFADYTMKQGGVTTLILGHKVNYDPEDTLTAANACLEKHFAYDYAKPWVGDGLITSSGEIWKRHRKLLTPGFGLPVVLNFLEVFNKQSRQLVQNLKVEVAKGPFDHYKYLKRSALQTFCITAMGITDFEDENFIQKYMDACDGILSIVTRRYQHIWLQNNLIFKLSGLKKKQDDLVKIAHGMTDEVLQKKKAMRRNGCEYTSGKYKPLLDLLLELSEDNALTDKEIREEVDTAIVAGFDTTSVILSYILILLGSHLEVQDKLYQEIIGVFETDRDVSKEDLQKLVYTEAVIKESIRNVSTGPVILRYVNRDVKLKNYTMRAGSECLLLLFGVHLNTTAWGKDAHEFRPERWLEPGASANPSTFVGFSLGKRFCLGKTYAMITMKTTLVHFIRRYKVTADASNLQLRFDFILKPDSGHEITLEERV